MPPVSIGSLASQSFTWTWSASGSGAVTFSATVSGVDSATLTALTARVSTSGRLQVPASLSGLASVAPLSAKQGDTITLILSAANSGEAIAIGVSPVAAVLPAGPLTAVSGPLPAGPVGVSGGSAGVFTWTYEAVLPGIVTFTASAAGSDGNSGAPLMAAGGAGPVTIQPAAVLKASVAPPALSCRVGEFFGFALTVSNTGLADAAGVGPSLLLENSSLATVTSGPTPAGPMALAAGAVTSFGWQLQARLAGALVLSASASGTDVMNLVPVGRIVPMTVAILPLLTGSASAVPAAVKMGGAVRLVLAVSNGGAIAATLTAASVGLSDAHLAVPAGPVPAFPIVLAPGETRSLAWDWTVRGSGGLTLTPVVAGTANGVPVSAGGSVQVAIESRFTEDVVAFPNPVRGDLLRMALRLDPAATRITVEVANAARDRVWRGEWARAEAPYGDLEIRGVARWAPGLYFLMARTRTDAGIERAYPPVKIDVRR